MGMTMCEVVELMPSVCICVMLVCVCADEYLRTYKADEW